MQSFRWSDVDASQGQVTGIPDPNMDPVGHELFYVEKGIDAFAEGVTQLIYDLSPDYCKAGFALPAFPKVEFAMSKDFRVYGGGGGSFPPDVRGLADQLKNFNFLPGKPRSLGLKVRGAITCGYYLGDLSPEQRHTSMEGTTLSVTGNVYSPAHVGVAQPLGSNPAFEFGYGPNSGVDVSYSTEMLLGPESKQTFGQRFLGRP